MAPKPPGRPSAKDIADLEMLEAVDTYTRIGAPFPTQPFLGRFPPNVIAAKLAKLHRRGFIDVRRHLTREGRSAFDAMQEKADA